MGIGDRLAAHGAIVKTAALCLILGLVQPYSPGVYGLDGWDGAHWELISPKLTRLFQQRFA